MVTSNLASCLDWVRWPNIFLGVWAVFCVCPLTCLNLSFQNSQS